MTRAAGLADLEVDLDAWRSGMRRAARREGMRIRTFVVEPAPVGRLDDVVDELGADLLADQLDMTGTGPVVHAVRTDLPPDLDTTMDAMNQLAADRLGPLEAARRPPAPVTSLADERARRTGHSCCNPGRR